MTLSHTPVIHSPKKITWNPKIVGLWMFFEFPRVYFQVPTIHFQAVQKGQILGQEAGAGTTQIADNLRLSRSHEFSMATW